MLNESTNKNWLVGLINQLRRRIFKDLEVQIPCEIVAVNSNRTEVTVKPLVTMIDKDGNRLSRNNITNIPVETKGAGDFLISFNIEEGDLGWIRASDRDISLFIQSHSENQPATDRMHSFSDAVFIPDVMYNFTIDSADAGAMTIQNRDSTVKIALDSEIRVTVGTTVLTITDSSVTWNADDGFTINGAQITSGGDVITASGVSLDNHYHTQGSDSDGDSQANTDTPTATE